jgi:hypothetical protein
MGGGETTLLVIAIALLGWARRQIRVKSIRPIRLGPVEIEIGPEAARTSVKSHKTSGRDTPVPMGNRSDDTHDVVTQPERTEVREN